MGKPILLIFFIAAMLSAACQSSAESFEPLRYKITYPTPADNFYFLDLYKNNRTNIYVCSYDNNRNKGYVNVYTLNGTRLWGTYFRGKEEADECVYMDEDIRRIYVDDIDNNHDLDIIVASALRGEKINLNPLYYFERETDEETGLHMLVQRWKYTGFEGIATDIAAADVNNDKKKEIIVASSLGYVYILKDTGVKETKNYVRPRMISKTYWFSTEIADMETDLNNEIVPERLREIIGKKGYKLNENAQCFITAHQNLFKTYPDDWRVSDNNQTFGLRKEGYELKVYNETLEPRIVSSYRLTASVANKYVLDGAVYSIFTDDLDGDGVQEIAAGTYQSIYFIDGSITWRNKLNERIKKVYATRLSGDQSYLVIGTDGDNVYTIGPDGKLKSQMEIWNVTDIIALDIDNDTQTEILAAVEDNIRAYYINGSFKWNYSVGKKILSLKVMSPTEIGVSTAHGIDILETDNRYWINKEAYKYYEQAQNYYLNRDCRNAMVPLEKARDLFRQINNSEGLLLCDNIDENCKHDFDRQRLADEYYAQAEKYFQEKNYADALTNVEKAMEIYVEIGDQSSVTWKCYPLKLKIEQEINGIKMDEAEKLFANAYVQYTKDDYVNATANLEKALAIYTEINYTKGIEECAALSAEIEKKVKMKEADQAYEEAKKFLEAKEYEQAIYPLEKALTIYQDINMTEKAAEVSSADNQTKNRLQADKYYSQAREYFDKGDYANATFYANESKSLYTSAEDYDKAETSAKLLSSIEGKNQEKNLTQIATVAGAIAIAMIIAATVILYVSKLKKKKNEDNSTPPRPPVLKR